MTRRYFQPHLDALVGYTPGEQPKRTDLVKLNTNECPYPPSPAVVEAIERKARERLNRYPDPLATEFRNAAAETFGVDPDWVVPFNGSDEALMLLVRATCGADGVVVSPPPTYLLYRVLPAIHGCRFVERPYQKDGTLPDDFCKDARIAFVANPNSPTGMALPPSRLLELAEGSDGLLVVDEAYADFADAHCIPVVEKCERLVVSRTMSKAYALAGVRFGFVVCQPVVAKLLRAMKDSYNCDALSIAAAAAAVRDQEWLKENVRRIKETRRRLERDLPPLGFRVTPSSANFVWAQRDEPVKPIYERLKERGILIRYLDYGPFGEGLRISVGTDAEIDRLFDEFRQVV
jgi:histidinol-phosphate aminotransferase